MAGKKRFPNGTVQYIFKKAGVLDKPLYLTFKDEAEGDAYAAQLEELLSRGIVPAQHQPQSNIVRLDQLVRAYELDAHPSPKDQGALNACLKKWGDTLLPVISAKWVDQIIDEMKRVEKLAPASIRARIGALARAADWGMRKGHVTLPDHPFRTLPDGYAQYSKADVSAAGVKRQDIERDRRLEPGEYERILAVIDGGVLARKQRPLTIEYPRAHRTLFILAVESAMRLSEMYTLSVGQVDLPKKTVFLEKTKNGDKRQVPLSSVALALMREHLDEREIPAAHPQDLVFPWWNGDRSTKARADVSGYLSKRFIDIFTQAKCEGLKFHDLRHEAVSRLFERTTLSESQIMKISGHKSHRMMMRYANLRGSDLAVALW
ncbi:site-specific integrase [Ralstonia sp. TCR112]|uniref:site-specific integrase n=1 Tax=Ralstonia sp. TCR112 TaxID=2601730 RepID=UPI0011BE5465|nr:site-specific integrase [Ralstonia sp. TCR112]TXD58911.1 site-specific integrase [Ralstonia sp. TCR112]